MGFLYTARVWLNSQKWIYCSVESRSAGAQRGREVEIGLKAAVDLDGGVTGADDALAFAPDGKTRNPLAKESIEALNNPVIEAYQTQSAAIEIEIRGQIMQPGKGLEILRSKAPILYLGSNQHAVRNRLGCNACQDRPPVVKGKLGQSHDRDRKQHCAKHSSTSKGILAGSKIYTNSPEVPVDWNYRMYLTGTMWFTRRSGD